MPWDAGPKLCIWKQTQARALLIVSISRRHADHLFKSALRRKFRLSGFSESTCEELGKPSCRAIRQQRQFGILDGLIGGKHAIKQCHAQLFGRAAGGQPL
jgi:hypothetical protein